MPDEHVYELDGEPLYSCPQAKVDPDILEAIDMHNWMERGFLPRPGGIDDQLERDLQKIMIVAGVKAEREEKNHGR